MDYLVSLGKSTHVIFILKIAAERLIICKAYFTHSIQQLFADLDSFKLQI